MQPRYPVYVPSKGRWQADRALTARSLQRYSVPFNLVVEPAQADEYRHLVPSERLLILPTDDFTLVAARNWIRDHAERSGHVRHWQLDDNIWAFHRVWEGQRIPCDAGVALAVCEDFADRFENLGIAGLGYGMFTRSGGGFAPAYFRNAHVYSCCLVDHRMPYRWRLLYNDDTDLCLQALSHGWATVALMAFTIKKITTMNVPGGNTDDLYRESDAPEARDTRGRYEMARVLERQWPGIVKVIRRFGRYQHSVNWRAFADVPLRLRPDVNLTELPEANEYGLVLRNAVPIKSEQMRALYDTYDSTLAGICCSDFLWRGLPAFRQPPPAPQLRLQCRTDADREALVQRLGLRTIGKFHRGGRVWTAWWPPRGQGDPSSLRFVTESEVPA